jgi:Ca-activated chloride channel family protein
MNKMKALETKLSHLSSVLLGLTFWLAGSAQAEQINLTATLATPVIQAGKPQKAFLKVAMTGFALPTREQRAPANVAIVIDKSGSMAGERIDNARRAAIMAVDGMGSNDIVSVIAFDDKVDVVTPATKVTDKNLIRAAIARIRPGGGTGLFAGVSKGASEVRKFLDKNRVNRVILLSDGQANVGPSTPAELGQLGSSFAREGISVSTIGVGLGYNEDLMTQLAGYSDGNHAFVENPQDLARIFKQEFGDVSSVVAQEIDVSIHLKYGIRPIRILGREGEISNDVVHLRMNQLYSEQEKFVILEVEIPAGKAGQNMNLAAVNVSYLNMQSKNKDSMSRAVAVGFSDSAEVVAKAVDKKVMTSAVQQVSNVTSKQALKLRDEGKVEEARRVLDDNAVYLNSQRSVTEVDALKKLEVESQGYSAGFSAPEAEWNAKRKSMKADQYRVEKQQKQ